MTPNDVPVITIMSQDPPPFISTGKLQKIVALDKITHFIHNFVTCGRVTTNHIRPKGRKDIDVLRIVQENPVPVEMSSIMVFIDMV